MDRVVRVSFGRVFLIERERERESLIHLSQHCPLSTAHSFNIIHFFLSRLAQSQLQTAVQTSDATSPIFSNVLIFYPLPT